MSRQRFYSLSAVCKHLGIPPHTLRYWEKEFEIKLARNSAGRRIVSAEQLKKFELIRDLLHRERMTIKGARRRLAELARADEDLPDSKNPRELLLWFKKRLLELRAELLAEEKPPESG